MGDEMSSGKGFYWERHSAAEKLLLDRMDEFKRANSVIADFENKLFNQTSSCLLDWIDHFILIEDDDLMQALEKSGFARSSDVSRNVYKHPGALLPMIHLVSGSSKELQGIALRVENVADFLQANNVHSAIEGNPFGRFRSALICTRGNVSFHAVERRDFREFDPSPPDAFSLQGYVEALEMWKNIPRGIDDRVEAFSTIINTAGKIVDMLGKDMAASVVCKCERDYWMTRNYAGRVQKSRQDVLGLGWANHDHHTFRSSRSSFGKLISLFSLLGFEKRERFYAGDEAGWGAQVMENTRAGLTLFLDVDLDPHEMDLDFSRDNLEEREQLGTIGLWCAMHGDSILKAGMHHLAGRFAFEKLHADMDRCGVKFMAPFSNFPYLKQAFSTPEVWEVDTQQIDALRSAGGITGKQAETFLQKGAVGSHLENIQRREGYKGFNKKNVSAIIKDTDPRR